MVVAVGSSVGVGTGVAVAVGAGVGTGVFVGIASSVSPHPVVTRIKTVRRNKTRFMILLSEQLWYRTRQLVGGSGATTPNKFGAPIRHPLS
jgi:hypothetical protein